MSITSRRIALLLVLSFGLLSPAIYAVTKVAVGPSTCQPSLVHFSTIGAAVASVPLNSTILVCPGTYPEQVVISQPLTLQGVTDGVGNAAIITVPAGGLVLNATSTLFGGQVTAQVAVENTVGVTINDITVDGTGDTCVSGARAEVGILFTNVGAPSDGVTAGKVENSVVRNVTACGTSEDILSDYSYRTITGNSLHGANDSCIIVGGGLTSITHNFAQQCYNGVLLDYTPSATIVSQNTFSNLNYNGNSVFLYGGAGGQITKNNSGPSPGPLFFGIGTDSYFGGVLVSGNTISGNAYGVALQFSYANVVQNNSIFGASLALYDVNSEGYNVLSHNLINEAAFGIFDDNTVTHDTLVPNNMYNVVTTVDPGPPPDLSSKNPSPTF